VSRRSTFLVSLVLVMLLAGASVVFSQSGETKQVGLIVAFPDGTVHTEAVTVPAAATTLDALRAAKIELVTQSGSFGESICKINATGCTADNCFCNAEKFWAYYHLAGSDWAVASEGVGAFVPPHQSVEGLVWSGFDASFNATEQPPVRTFAQLQAASDRPVPVAIPAALLLLGAGAAGLVVYMRRKRSSA
jgi:hypothetical protein